MSGQKNYLEDFYDWMVTTGKKPHKRAKPSLPLAPSASKCKHIMVRRVLVDLGFVKRVPNSGRGNTYLVWPEKGCKRIYDLRPEHITAWIEEEFKLLIDNKELGRKAHYVNAVWKFGEYLHWEMKDRHGDPLWTAEQLAKLKYDNHAPSVTQDEITILPLGTTDEFLEFIKDQDITTYTMAYLSRWLGGMRYQEVINAPLDLNGRTLKIDFKTNRVTIWGKGKGGLQKQRYPALLPQVKEVLQEYIEYRRTLVPATEEDGHYLFLSRNKKHSENSKSTNQRLRRYAKAWGKLSQKELSLTTTHKIGRHSFGTYFCEKVDETGNRYGMPDGLLMKEMGIENVKTLERYKNIATEQRVAMMQHVVARDNGNSKPRPQNQEDGTNFSKILKLTRNNNLTKEQKAQIIAGLL